MVLGVMSSCLKFGFFQLVISKVLPVGCNVVEKVYFPHKKWLQDSLRLHRWSFEGEISGSLGGGGHAPGSPIFQSFSFKSVPMPGLERENITCLWLKKHTLNMGCSTARSTVNVKSWWMYHCNLYVLFSVCVGIDFVDFTWESIT